jgi:hypothetical protein
MEFSKDEAFEFCSPTILASDKSFEGWSLIFLIDGF